jgi:CHAT domain-containing protein
MNFQKNHIFPTFLLLIWVHCLLSQSPEIIQLQNNLSNYKTFSDSSADICRQLTKLYARERDAEKALKMAEREVEILKGIKKSKNNDSLLTTKLAEAYFNVASLNRSLSAYPTALNFAYKSLEIYQSKSAKGTSECPGIYKFLAQTYYLNEEYDAAEKFAEMACSAYQKQKNRMPAAEINLQILSGSILLKKAAFHEAEKKLNSAKKLYYVYKEELPIDLLARIYTNLAHIKLEQQSTVEALSYFMEIAKIRITKHHKGHFSLQNTYTNIGFCYYKLENYEKALNYHRKSMEILNRVYEKKNEMTAFAHNHLGGTFQKLGIVDSAQYHLEESILVYRKIFGNKSQHTIAPLWRLSKLFRTEKDYNKSKKYLDRVLEVQEKHFGLQHPDLAKMYLDMTYLYEEQKEYKTAFYYSKKAWQCNLRNQIITDKTLMLAIIEVQSGLSVHLSNKEMYNSYNLFKKVKTIVNLSLADMSSTEDKLSLIKNLRKVCRRGIELCFSLHRKFEDDKYIERIHELMEYNKSVLLSMQIRQRQIQNNHTDLKHKQKQKVLEEIQFLEQKWKKAEYAHDSLVSVKLQHQLFKRYENLEQTIEKGKIYENHQHVIRISEIQKKLNPRQAVLNYFYEGHYFYLIIIEKHRLRLKKIAYDFETELQQFLKYLLNLDLSKINIKQSCSQYDIYAHTLYQKLVPDLNSNQLIIIPDYKLEHLPFEALTSRLNPKTKGFHDLHYLLHDYTISYASSVTTFYHQQYLHRNHKKGRILAFAPDYSNHPHLHALRYNNKEAEYIQKIYKGMYYYKNSAIKAKFITESPEFSILHLAVHAYSDKDKHETAKLFFSYKNNSTESILYPHEIIKLNLKADLIVLSACKTAIGYWQEGEGTMSLSRDFMFAGAAGLLTSYWQIDDKSSHQLMKEFYNQLKYLNKAESLKKAKQKYLKTASAFQGHPYFWSGLIINGNINRLDLEIVTFPKKWYLAAFLICLSAILIIYRKAQQIKP